MFYKKNNFKNLFLSVCVSKTLIKFAFLIVDKIPAQFELNSFFFNKCNSFMKKKLLNKNKMNFIYKNFLCA